MRLPPNENEGEPVNKPRLVRPRHCRALVALVPAVGLLGLLSVSLGAAHAGAVPVDANGRIAFVYGYDIYTMNADGSDRTPITQTPNMVDVDPQWSSDGTRIAFASTVSSQTRYELFTMNADGSGLTRVISTPSFDLNPAWSPDGTQLLFERATTSSATLQQIWMVNVDGTGLHAVSSPNNFSSEPAWSPDGNKIAYDGEAGGYPGQIVIANPDGSGAVTVSQRIPTNGWRHSPSWSPDGTKIVLSDDIANVGSIWAMNADGTDPQQLTSNQYGDTAPVWSPDGSHIAYTSGTSSSGLSEIFTMAADGSAKTRVSDDEGFSAEPDWQRALPTTGGESTSTAPAGTTPTDAMSATTAITGGDATGASTTAGAGTVTTPTMMASGSTPGDPVREPTPGDAAREPTANTSSTSSRTPWVIAAVLATAGVAGALAVRVRRR